MKLFFHGILIKEGKGSVAGEKFRGLLQRNETNP